jgi:hypothetical protein
LPNVKEQSNFDKLKTQMLEKKKKAEQNINAETSIGKSNYINVSHTINRSENKDVSKDVNNNVNKSVNKDANEDVTKEVNKSVNAERQGIITIAKKKSEEDKLIRATYYVRESQNKNLDKLAKMTGKGKNEILRELLDSALNMIQVVEE